MGKKPSEIAGAIVEMLEPLTSEERHRILQAAMTLLGESSGQSRIAIKSESAEPSAENGFPPKAKNWMKQYGVSIEELENVFHVESDGVEVIASTLPGKSNAEKCNVAYILTGVANFLSDGEPKFSDDTARDLCTKAGCYDKSNHGKFIRGMSNEFAGAKAKGWILTGPGLKSAATIIKSFSAV